MGLDIKIHSEDGRFKFRVCGIIKRGEKYLLQLATDGRRYVFPGGHIELGESTSEAVIREVFEEVHVKTKINRLVCINENLFYNIDGIRYNEIGFYYLLDCIEGNIPEDETFMLSEIDKGQYREHTFKWANIDSELFLNAQPKVVVESILESVDYPLYKFTDDR